MPARSVPAEMTPTMRWRLGYSVLFLPLAVATPLWGGKPGRVDRYGDPLPPGAVARIGTGRFSDRGSAYAAVAYSPDGKVLGAVDSLGNIDIWDATAGKLQRSFGPPDGKRPPGEKLDLVTNWPYASWEAHAFFSPDGKTLLTGSDHWPIRLWDITSGKELAVMEGSKGGVLGLAVAPDFKTVAAAGKTDIGSLPHLVPNGSISLWDVRSGKSLRQWQGGEKVWALAWSHDGKTLASGDHDRCVRFWDPATGKPRGKQTGFGCAVVGIAYSPDGKTLATADMDRNLALWDLTAHNKRTRQWRVEVPPDSNSTGPGRPSLGGVAFTPDGKRLLTRDVLNECPLDVWDVPSGKRLWQFAVEGGPRSICCAVSPDGRTLATVQPGCLYDLVTGKQRFDSPGRCVDDLQFLPGGQALVTNQRDLWDVATGKKIRGLTGRLPIVVAPDGKHIAEWRSEAISLRDLTTGREVRSLPTKFDGPVGPLVFAPDGRTVAAFGGPSPRKVSERHTSVRFWDVASGAEQRPISLRACPRDVSRVVLSADARLVAGLGQASGGKGAPPGEKVEGPAGPCYLWDRASGRKLRTIDLGPIPATTYFSRKIAFSPDGRVLASFGDNGCQLWEVVTGKCLRRLTGRTADAAAFSPDSCLLAWSEREPGDGKPTIRLTDLATGKECLRLSGHTRPVTALAFSPNGKRLASGAEDASALVWDLTGLRPRKKVKALTLTKEELQALWADLGGDDAVRAQEALLTLSLAPGEAIAFLDARRAEWAKEMERVGKRVGQLLAEVDSDKFKVREEATRALLVAGPNALPLVLTHLRGGRMSLEAQRRLEHVRDALEGNAQDVRAAPLGLVRATGLLERLGTAEARRVLERLAEGVGPPAEEARASLRRWKR
ncbi:MAG TPA: hypothetical protein VKD72_23330 [Gemmataceae bacterium]|nr:hypothetical protein [Gemmataceae bacterium]